MIEKAKAFACEAHSEQRRKGPLDLPYSVHLEEVAAFVSRHAGDEIAIAAAWLHDTVEDVGIPLNNWKLSSALRSPKSFAN